MDEYEDMDGYVTDENGHLMLQYDGIPGSIYRVDAFVLGPEGCPDYSHNIRIEVRPPPVTETPEEFPPCKNLVKNGGFESPAINSGYTTLSQGHNLDSWNIISGSVDLVRSYWQPSEKSQSLDIAGSESGSIEQQISVNPGNYYELSFDLAGNPDTNKIKQVTVYWDNEIVGREDFNNAAWKATHMDMKWRKKITYKYLLGDSDGISTLRFESTNPDGSDAWGAVIDNVWVCDMMTGPVRKTQPAYVSPAPTSISDYGNENWIEGLLRDLLG
ncbi:DUF642 domain-containing protein [Methanospirillum hungatei]|uniref:DUF642 domain-containing protein n=1 Tax=Methanospirillum hungatei TaxID=2203 RepID=UPI0026EB11C1|nr:DUF642 domain-containing protein [Methanospirillum hungatei]MCA1917454.1 DUF642 domain-containing protein [Methanospirillum hungatei]